MKQLNKQLAQIVIEISAFFELSDDEIVDEDIAIEQLEQIAYYLKEMDKDQIFQFIKYTEELAEVEQKNGNIEKSNFIKTIPDNFGLI